MQKEDNWEQYASCLGWPSVFEKDGEKVFFDPFFEEFEELPEIRKSVREMCARCPVAEICGVVGGDGKTGVWNGKYLVNGEPSDEFN